MRTLSSTSASSLMLTEVAFCFAATPCRLSSVHYVLHIAVASLLGGCTTITSDGRSFPVNVKYIGSRPLASAAGGSSRDLEEEISSVIAKVLSESAAGDILTFLPGEREIRGVASHLERRLPEAVRSRLSILPLYGALPFEQQQQAIAPSSDGRRRVILSTTLAESSVTIAGVRHVVDSGLRRSSIYDPAVGMAALVTRCSRARL